MMQQSIRHVHEVNMMHLLPNREAIYDAAINRHVHEVNMIIVKLSDSKTDMIGGSI